MVKVLKASSFAADFDEGGREETPTYTVAPSIFAFPATLSMMTVVSPFNATSEESRKSARNQEFRSSALVAQAVEGLLSMQLLATSLEDVLLIIADDAGIVEDEVNAFTSRTLTGPSMNMNPDKLMVEDAEVACVPAEQEEQKEEEAELKSPALHTSQDL